MVAEGHVPGAIDQVGYADHLTRTRWNLLGNCVTANGNVKVAALGLQRGQEVEATMKSQSPREKACCQGQRTNPARLRWRYFASC
jgi:hypothetical protein